MTHKTMVNLFGALVPADQLQHALVVTALDQQMEGKDPRQWQLAAAYLAKLSAADQLRALLLPPQVRVTLNEWTRQYGVALSTARRWAREGYLQTADKTGSTWFVDMAEQPLTKGKHHGKASGRGPGGSGRGRGAA